MPLLSKLEAPVSAWCNLRQAFQWIAHDILPRPEEYEDAFHIQRICHLHGEGAKAALAQFYLKIVDSTLPVFGRAGEGVPLFGHDRCGNPAIDSFESWSSESQIPPGLIGSAGIDSLEINANQIGNITDWEELDELDNNWNQEIKPINGWLYRFVRIPTISLFRAFKSDDGIELPYMADLEQEICSVLTTHLSVSTGSILFPPAQSLPLSLMEAACLWAFGDHEWAFGGLSPQENDTLIAVQRRLLASLEARYLMAEGNLGSQWHAGRDPFEEEWRGHATSATAIPSGAWKTGIVNWSTSTLTTSQGEYIAVRLSETAVRDLAGWWTQRQANPPCEMTATIPAYIDSSHPNYAPKLAAAIAAWEAVTNDPALTKGKSEKSAMIEWLSANAGRFDLLKADGGLNAQGIEEVAKVANWNTGGGAPRTPG